MLSSISSTCWTCVVSLVVRVISEAVLKWSNWCDERRAARSKMRPRTIAAEAGGHSCREETAGDGARGADDRDDQHHAADCQDSPGVAGHDAVVDDVGHQPREIQVGEGLRERQHHHHADRAAKRPEEPE